MGRFIKNRRRNVMTCVKHFFYFGIPSWVLTLRAVPPKIDDQSRAPDGRQAMTYERISKVLLRDVTPRIKTQEDFETPSALLKSLMTALFALPSSGIVVT